MNTYLNMTKIALEGKGIHYIEFEECVIGVGFTMDDNSHLKFTLAFDEQEKDCTEDTNHMHISTYIENHNMKDRFNQALELCNTLNQEYRWAKFYIDRDYDISCAADAILSDEKAGEECIELMFKLMTIIDEVMPRIMQLKAFGVTMLTAPALEKVS